MLTAAAAAELADVAATCVQGPACADTGRAADEGQVARDPATRPDHAVRLRTRRTNLIDRNNSIPTNVPALWATLHQRARGEALARSITNPGQQVWALVVARAVAVAGDCRLARTAS